MNLELVISSAVLFVALVAIAGEIVRERAVRRARARRKRMPPRRALLIEARMRSAFDGPRDHHGDCFADFSIWRLPDGTRMDVTTRGPWASLSRFTRSLIVRHLWRSLKDMVSGAVVVCVDPGTSRGMVWTAAETEQFDDCGVVSAWMPQRRSRVGTLISGR